MKKDLLCIGFDSEKMEGKAENTGSIQMSLVVTKVTNVVCIAIDAIY